MTCSRWHRSMSLLSPAHRLRRHSKYKGEPKHGNTSGLDMQSARFSRRCLPLLLALQLLGASAALVVEENGVRNCWRVYAGAAEPAYQRFRLLACVTGNLAGKGKTGLAFLHVQETPEHAVPVKSKLWATSKLVATHALLAVFDAVFIFILL